MKNWLDKNYKLVIVLAFLVPIITVALVSISHVSLWYGLSNPPSWAIYLSIGIEIAALSALAAISVNLGSKVYLPFSVVTFIQFIGNVFFAYSYINVDTKLFLDWVDLVSPVISFMGVEPTDFVGHKRLLALFSGGLLPIISLSFLHMLVKFSEDNKNKELNNTPTEELNNPINDDKQIISEDNKELNSIPTKDTNKLIDDDKEIISEDVIKNLENHYSAEVNHNIDQEVVEKLEKYIKNLEVNYNNETVNDDLTDEELWQEELLPNYDILTNEVTTEEKSEQVEVLPKYDIDPVKNTVIDDIKNDYYEPFWLKNDDEDLKKK